MDKWMEQLKTQVRAERPSAQAVERCIRSLPQVRRKASLLPLLRLQLSALPHSIYGGTAVLLLLVVLLGGSLRIEDAQLISATVSAALVLLLGWQLLFAETACMAELEHTCKYGFGQILLARILCLFGCALGCVLLSALPLLRAEDGLCHGLVMVLPTVLGALAALVWNGLTRSNRGMAAVYACAALVTAYHWELFFTLGLGAVLAILAGATALLLLALWNTAKRRMNCEAHLM